MYVWQVGSLLAGRDEAEEGVPGEFLMVGDSELARSLYPDALDG